MVRESGAEIDGWGGGRFDLVGWDPRGTNANTPVQCFTSEASETKFWQGMEIPTTDRTGHEHRRSPWQLRRQSRLAAQEHRSWRACSSPTTGAEFRRDVGRAT